MKTRTHIQDLKQGLMHRGTRLALSASVLVGSLIIGSAPVTAAPSQAPSAAPAATRAADMLPASTCPLDAGTGTFQCDLWAMTGNVTLPGLATPVAIWGYASSAAGPAALPGPTLIVTQGITVNITLHNVNLPSATSLSLSGQPVVADTAGVTAGNAKTYTFTAGALKPGTTLYEAGLTADGPRQVAMGLYGALIVRPAAVTFTGISVARTDPSAAVASGSATVTDPAVLATDVGSTVSGLGIPPGTTITAVAAGSFTLSTNATANGAGVVIKRTDAAATVASGTATVTDAAVLATDVGSAVSGAGIAPGTTIAAVGVGSFTLSAPAQSAAYGPRSAYDDEALLVLSEIDPALNAAPTTYDLGKFAPKYWLINGKSYPNTALINTATSHKVLLRYVNAGLVHHSMSVASLHQTIYATDGNPAANLVRVVAQTIPTGGTLDTIVTMPASAPTNAKYPVFEAAMHMDNSGASTGGVINFGGMLTFLTVAGTTGGNVGPVTSNVAITPNPSNGTAPVTLSATLADPDGVAKAEYFVDTLGANGTGCTMSGTTSATAIIPISGATAPCVDLTTLTSGTHTFYVHGLDLNATPAWGAPASVAFTLAKTGPVILNGLLTPALTNGTADVALQATASDVVTNVVAAEYFIDPVGSPAPGTGIAIPVAAPANQVSLNATLPAATVAALTEGTHTIAVRAQDALGNWGALTSLVLTLDKTGPNTASVIANPNPTNGTIGVQGGTGGAYYERIDATVTDPTAGAVNSGIVAAEYFVDGPVVTGTGHLMLPTAGTFAGPSAGVYQLLDLFGIAALPEGTHTIYVHGKDAAGNWGPVSTGTLRIDKQAPTVSGLTLTPAATNSTAVTVAANATDVATGNSNIAGGEFFIDTTGTAGTGTAMVTATVGPAGAISGQITPAVLAGLTEGNHTVYVHAQDVAGNWGSTFVTAILKVDRTPPTFTSITLSPNSITVGTASVNLTVNGATDGATGSGVVGGEYWIGAANIPPGTGTAFNGTSASVNTSALAVGTYTVNARIRDAAGNWSSAQSATLTVVGDAIFSDGFESGSTSAWSGTSTNNTTRLNVSNVTPLVGTYSLRAQGSNNNYVNYTFGTGANPASSSVDVRFYFRPNGNNGNGQDIFVARNGTNNLFRIRYRLNGGAPQVQIQTGATNTSNGAWTNINAAANNVIEVTYQSGGSIKLYVNNTNSASPDQTITAGVSTVTSFRLGANVVGATTGNATLESFDAFVAKRSLTPLIGP